MSHYQCLSEPNCLINWNKIVFLTVLINILFNLKCCAILMHLLILIWCINDYCWNKEQPILYQQHDYPSSGQCHLQNTIVADSNIWSNKNYQLLHTQHKPWLWEFCFTLTECFVAVSLLCVCSLIIDGFKISSSHTYKLRVCSCLVFWKMLHVTILISNIWYTRL